MITDTITTKSKNNYKGRGISMMRLLKLKYLPQPRFWASYPERKFKKNTASKNIHVIRMSTM